VLSDADTDAPDLPAIGTVSTGDEWESGGRGIGVAAAARGRVWVDRPYWTGNPSAGWLAEQANAVIADGGTCQLGNELNLALEDFSGGPGAWAALDAEVRALVADPSRVLAMPPSPGVAGWQEWVTEAGPFACHAYGTCQQMMQVVQWYLDNRAGDVYITECNFGAGNTVDVEQWANLELAPFLDWCAAIPRVKTALYFAWTWNESANLPTSVDAAGTAVQTVLEQWEDPPSGFDINLIRDSLWQTAETLENGGWPWFGQGIKALVALSKGDK